MESRVGEREEEEEREEEGKERKMGKGERCQRGLELPSLSGIRTRGRESSQGREET
ncbi:uncharacterized protein DS421_7g222250 [Arachis hypogaea]|nr:uncharacterized protein DS421_7g222250 [Arachis hypogaea]